MVTGSLLTVLGPNAAYILSQIGQECKNAPTVARGPIYEEALKRPGLACFEKKV
jgi:hypothetical protein